MGITLEQALQATHLAVEEINLTRSDETQLDANPDVTLFGDGSTLDSIGLVNVVMAVEAHLGDLTGQDIVLASEAAMSRRNSPYRSLGALAEYAVEVSEATT